MISKLKWILFLVLTWTQAALPQSFVLQQIDHNASTSGVLLVDGFAADGRADIVTTDADNNLLCYPNPNTKGVFAVPPIINSTQFAGVPLPQITTWASANLLGNRFGPNVLLGINGSLISYISQPPNASSGCAIRRYEWMGPTGAGSPNVLLSGFGLVSGAGPDVLVGSADGSFSVIYNNNWDGLTGTLGTDGSQNLGLQVQGAVAGNVGNINFTGAWQLADGSLLFISPSLPSLAGPAIPGTISTIVNTPNGSTFLVSTSGSTLYLSQLTWSASTPNVVAPVTFNFPAAISSVAVGSFGNGFNDLAIATADGKITIVSDNGQGVFSLGQSTIVEAGANMTIAASVLATTGPNAGMTDLAIQTNTGNLYVAWQTIPVAAPVITTQPASQTVAAGQTATFSVTATGTNLSYQWQQGSAAIAGATTASYTTPATTYSQNGAAFQVVVSNPAGSATSQTAILTVTPSAPASYILTVNTSGTPGNVAQEPPGTTFTSGTVVTLTESAGTGSVFAGWSGACSGTQAVCAVTMDQNKTVLATFAAAPGFSLNLNPASASVLAGSGASSAITVTPIGGFTGSPVFTCSGAPSKSTCTVTGTTVAITTTAATTSAGFGSPSILGALTGFLVLLVLPRKSLRRTALAAFILVFALTGLAACNGGSVGTQQLPPAQVPGTPSGSYNIIVTGTSKNITASSTFTLVVK